MKSHKTFFRIVSSLCLLGLFLGSGLYIFAPQKISATTLTFTSSGSWVAPLGVTSIYVSVNGGGGGGAFAGGGGGGGGCNENSSYSVTPGNTYSFNVGAGGAGAVGSGGGGNGGGGDFDGSVFGTGGQGGFTGSVGGSGGGGTRNGGDGFSFFNGDPSSIGGSSANCPGLTPGVNGGATGNPGDGGTGGIFSSDGTNGVDGWVYISYTLTANTPTGLTALSGENTHIPVSWNTVTTTEVVGYRLYRNTDGYTTPIYDSASLSFDDTGLTNGVTYSYKVTSYNADTESAKSGIVSATPMAPAIVTTQENGELFGDW